MAAHFGTMLLERRRAMGMSIQQVANTIKIRPQIIEFFETENFAAMPPRGYAQGMISSYARYLGLNPRVVVDAYFDALSAYEHGSGMGPVRYQEYAADASPRSANATGRFLMVGGAPASASRYAQRPPQAGYVSEGVSPHEPVAAGDLRPLPMVGRGSDGPRRAAGRDDGYGSPGVTSRIPVQNGERPRRGGSAPSAYGHRPQRMGSAYGSAQAGRSAEPSSGRPPRATFRSGSSVPPRGGDPRRGRGGSVPPRRGGQGGYRGGNGGGGFQLDSRFLIAIIAALLFVIMLLGVLAIRGCAPDSSTDTGGSAPKAEMTGTEKSDSDDIAEDEGSGSDASDPAAAETGAADPEAAAKAQEPKETKVKVAIKEKGAVAFLEVKLDGKSVLGAQEVGPFEQEFTVTQQIEITTDKPSDVTVTKNGEKVRYDMKVSGVAKVTITAPKQEEPKAEDGAADGQATDGGDQAATE